MSDPRYDTVAEVLRENGVQANLADTDTLAARIVNALDREHGAPEAGDEPTGEHDTVTAANAGHDDGERHDDGAEQ